MKKETISFIERERNYIRWGELEVFYCEAYVYDVYTSETENYPIRLFRHELWGQSYSFMLAIINKILELEGEK